MGSIMQSSRLITIEALPGILKSISIWLLRPLASQAVDLSGWHTHFLSPGQPIIGQQFTNHGIADAANTAADNSKAGYEGADVCCAARDLEIGIGEHDQQRVTQHCKKSVFKHQKNLHALEISTLENAPCFVVDLPVLSYPSCAAG